MLGIEVLITVLIMLTVFPPLTVELIVNNYYDFPDFSDNFYLSFLDPCDTPYDVISEKSLS